MKSFDSNKINEVRLFCDSKVAISLAERSKFEPRTKHIGINHNFIRECVKNGHVKISEISTKEMVADVLTKALPINKFEKFEKFRKRLGIGEHKNSNLVGGKFM